MARQNDANGSTGPDEPGYDDTVLKRAAMTLLGVAVLCGSGMPLRLPCCSLRKLEATALQSDCCPIPGCTLAERAGPAAAAIREATALENPSAAATPAAIPGRTFAPVSGVFRVASALPPRGGPPRSLLSVYRI